MLCMLPEEQTSHYSAVNPVNPVNSGLVKHAHLYYSAMNTLRVTDYFPTGLKSQPSRQDPYLTPLSGREPVARQVKSPRGEVTTIILLRYIA